MIIESHRARVKTPSLVVLALQVGARRIHGGLSRGAGGDTVQVELLERRQRAAVERTYVALMEWLWISASRRAGRVPCMVRLWQQRLQLKLFSLIKLRKQCRLLVPFLLRG